MPEFITSLTPGVLRNDFADWVGIYFTVGARDIIISDLGRLVLPGNAQSHDLIIYDPPPSWYRRREPRSREAEIGGGLPDAPSLMMPLASATIATAGKPAGAFTYAAIREGPLRLFAGKSYLLGSFEYVDGDFFAEPGAVENRLELEVSNDFAGHMAAFVEHWDSGGIVVQPEDSGVGLPNFIYELADPWVGIARRGAADLGNNNGALGDMVSAYTVDPVSNFLVVVADGAYGESNPINIIGVTYGGVPMVAGPAMAGGGGAATQRCHTSWGLLSPPTGTNSLVIHQNNTGSDSFILAVAADYSGVEALDGDVAAYTARDPVTSLHTPIPINTPGAWIISGFGGGGQAGQSNTRLRQVIGGAAYNFPFIFDSDDPITETGVYDNTYNFQLAVASSVIFSVIPQVVLPTIRLDPAAHAPVEAAGNVSARVFPRPVGVRLDPATHPRVEVSSR